MKYKHIIWDWNGTLLDDFWLCLKVLNGQLARRNLSIISTERYQETFGFPIQQYYEANGFDFSAECFLAANAEHAEGYESRRLECDLRSGALGALKRNCNLGIGQSILSALYQPALNASVDQFGIRDMFFIIRGMSNKIHTGKAKGGKVLLAEIGLPPEKILYVGDVVGDYIAATEMGIDCILISGTQSLERLKATGAKVIDSFSELYEYAEVMV